MAIPVGEVPAEVVDSTIFVKDIPISKMKIKYVTDPDGFGYARPERPKRSEKLAKNFDTMAVGVLYLSLQDDGTYHVIDGQHRLKAAQKAGIEYLDALVFIDLTIEEEAALYRKFGDYLKQTTRDRYLAAQVEGHPETLAIDKMLDEVGLHVSRSGGPEKDAIFAVQALENVAKNQGPAILRDTLHLLRDVFDTNYRGFSSASLQGTAAFLERFGRHPYFNRKKLVGDMQREGLAGIMNKANAVRAVETTKSQMGNAGAWGRALLIIHDTGLRSKKLGDWTERVVRPETKVKMAENLRTKATPASIAKRLIEASEKAMRIARCPNCRAEPGAACSKIEHGRSVPMNGRVHQERWAEAKRVQRRAGYENGKS